MTISCTLAATPARSECAPPADAYALGCRCYDASDLKKLADGLTQLQVCHAALLEKDALIKDRLVDHPPETALVTEWYEDPRWVVGGMVVTGSLASILTIWLIKK